MSSFQALVARVNWIWATLSARIAAVESRARGETHRTQTGIQSHLITLPIRSGETVHDSVRISGTVPLNIYGIEAGPARHRLSLFNIGSHPFTLKGDSPSAGDPTQRIVTPEMGDYILRAGAGVELWYDPEISRWRVLDSPSGSGGNNAKDQEQDARLVALESVTTAHAAQLSAHSTALIDLSASITGYASTLAQHNARISNIEAIIPFTSYGSGPPTSSTPGGEGSIYCQID